MAAAGDTTPLGAILGLIGTIGAFSLIPRWFGKPTYGPRLLPGEMKASQSSSLAARAYWVAEEAASRGSCKIADKAWTTAELYRSQAAERRRRGDQTGVDLRSAVRNARTEIRKCRAHEG